MADDFAPPNVFGPSTETLPKIDSLLSTRDAALQDDARYDTPVIPSSLLGDAASNVNLSGTPDSDDDDVYVDADQEDPTRQGTPLPSVDGGHEASNISFKSPPTDVDGNTGLPPKSASKVPDLDLSHSIKGLYRILDLIIEQGSGGGLVDKIIISQDSLQAFVNDMQPGAFASLTKVDFKLLDKVLVGPVGIYGDKKAIVDFLNRLGAVEKEIAAHLLKTEDERERSTPSLRSGLYVLRVPPSQGNESQIYVIYWPEDTTWNDGTASSVRRNRVTFMRYLSKICDQSIALLSADYAQSIVWKESEDDDTDTDSDDEGDERMGVFVVCKTNEQEESVKVRPGFTARVPMVASPERRHDTAPDVAIPMQPTLIRGETTQGFMTAGYKAAVKKVDEYNNRTINKTALESYIKDRETRLSFNPALDQPTIEILMQTGLRSRCEQLCRSFNTEVSDAQRNLDSEFTRRKADTQAELRQNLPQMTMSFRNVMADRVMEKFPSLDAKRLLGEEMQTQGISLDSLAEFYPKIKGVVRRARDEQPLKAVPAGALQSPKERILVITHLFDAHGENLSEETQSKLVNMIDEIKNIRAAWMEMSKSLHGEGDSQGYLNRLRSGLKSLLSTEDNSTGERAYKEAMDIARATSDADFMSRVEDTASRWPVLEKAINAAMAVVYDHFTKNLKRLSDNYAREVLHIQDEGVAEQFKREQSDRTEQSQRDLCSDLARKLNEYFSEVSFKKVFHVDAIRKTGYYSYHSPTLSLRGRIETTQDDKIVYRAHLMQITNEDRQEMRLNNSFIPSPRFNLAYTFSLPTGREIIYSQLLENEQFLLVTRDRGRDVFVYRESLAALEGAVANKQPKLRLSHDKIGGDILVSFNEGKQMLAICEPEKLQLHFFVFEEGARALKASGSAISLALYYNGVTIQYISFICGDEELLLVDSSVCGRIFSLVTMQFRPATLQFATVPSAVYTSPDGSCFLASCSQDSSFSVTAYHWNTFGSNEGIQLAIDDLGPEDDFVLTSISSRNAVHLMKLDINSQTCLSFALDITRKSTELMFREKGGKPSFSTDKDSRTSHNCLIDCHSEVWTRFPVVPAVQRQAITRASSRRPKSLTFVSDFGREQFSPHFSELIQTFERTTRKPTGTELSSIAINSMTFNDFYNILDDLCISQTSNFRAGEWLVELLCLIPIHLAITKDNRFIPLKDGVFSPELERSLLGAEVGRIVDSLSFGWYESIFQSYMASKPVKVVSSMGEQSVGKSFALNHLADTSFAGSAMRTTEGVWMSVTPTEDTLIVALDFEGVHSIERSAQEDTLLVLFNTAISNLVLFRNNFALSRDIAGLFQSFQSSSTVLDPAANPMLFQSTLVIIIKDVVDADAKEIKKE
ncbi:hypothetical protein CONPUDRAFT_165528 [Coniophora puteana RWD-64-598 SS2]|uniref:Guanylate-binding protein N-terminal domain-containing protein n=1 Tax=Coniophora puteana (strain RWD-64-598) TaxID=741705 RepID=A0A5M3MQL1_CONPW|nr:uncharacterized protein CONPUDRAFT_165528 [Coniophora puteana RWD-64-598 SS2]EIW81360.1 hypothetical protein CONPUDRAFT_165528 [Coniophora puteana RWD-64-598 SS2]